jgi:hypothetical protein
MKINWSSSAMPKFVDSAEQDQTEEGSRKGGSTNAIIVCEATACVTSDCGESETRNDWTEVCN